MRSLIDFIKYNNAVPIILAVGVLGAGVAFAASPKLRQAVLPQTVAPAVPLQPKPTDTAKLRLKDLGTFDLDVRIDSLTEDTEGYFVAYSYTTLEVAGGEWQEVRKNGKMDIPKALLGKRDLKTYLVEQIGQVIDRELAYLKEAQTAATAAGASRSASRYASLAGTKIDAAARAEVKENEEKNEKKNDEKSLKNKEDQEDSSETETSSDDVGNRATVAGTTLTEEQIREIIVKAVSDFLAVDVSMPEPAVTEPVSEPSSSQTEESVGSETGTDMATETEPAEETPSDPQTETGPEESGSE